MELHKIEQLLNCKSIALIGASPKKEKTGGAIYQELKKQNYKVLAINPKYDFINEDKCFKSLNELHEKPEALIVATKPEITTHVVKQAVDLGIIHIFIQLGAQSQEAIDYANNKEINLIYKRCILMFLNPKGVHKFHEVCAKLFRTYPK